MHANKAFDTTPHGRPVLGAPTPEDLIAAGDVDALRRFLMLAGDGEYQDAARQSLYDAAANGLCRTQDKSKVYRLCVYGWPVTLCYSAPVTQSASISLTSSRNRNQSPGPRGLLLKMREFWQGAFGNGGVLVSPMVSMTHISCVLGLTPLTLRDATRHGIALVQGVKHPSVWSFERTGTSQVSGCADVPLTYLLSAWVCSKVSDPAPQVQMGRVLMLEMQQLMCALMARRDDSTIEAYVGQPAVYHDAITQGQSIHVDTMRRCAAQKGVRVGTHIEMDAMHLQVNLGITDSDGESFESLQEWRYSHIWRPLDHLALMQSDLLLTSTLH